MSDRTLEAQPCGPDGASVVRRRWRRLGSLVAVVVLGALAAGVLLRLFVLRDSSKPVSIAEAVSRYRSSRRTREVVPPAIRQARLPPPGVYAATTAGIESLSGAPLGDARHAYPRSTAVVIQRDRCGLLERWFPLDGRERDVSLCPTAAGWRMRAAVDLRTFFNVQAPRDYSCGRGVVELPARPRVGQRWRWSCRAGGFSDFVESGSSVVVARQTMRVAGTAVRAVHVQSELRLTGAVNGRAVRDTWRRAADGLLLRETYSESSVMSTHVGPLEYRDRFALELSSLRPVR